MICASARTRKSVMLWSDRFLERIHELQSTPEFIKREVERRSGASLHDLQGYRMAVRQELRKRGLPVTV